MPSPSPHLLQRRAQSVPPARPVHQEHARREPDAPLTIATSEVDHDASATSIRATPRAEAALNCPLTSRGRTVPERLRLAHASLARVSAARRSALGAPPRPIRRPRSSSALRSALHHIDPGPCPRQSRHPRACRRTRRQPAQPDQPPAALQASFPTRRTTYTEPASTTWTMSIGGPLEMDQF